MSVTERSDTVMADTAGLGPQGDAIDRPGPTAAIEEPVDQGRSDKEDTQ